MGLLKIIGNTTEHGIKALDLYLLWSNPKRGVNFFVGTPSPGKDKEANWLPAPEGKFWVVFRTYGPGPKIVDQTWKLPPLELTK